MALPRRARRARFTSWLCVACLGLAACAGSLRIVCHFYVSEVGYLWLKGQGFIIEVLPEFARVGIWSPDYHSLALFGTKNHREGWLYTWLHPNPGPTVNLRELEPGIPGIRWRYERPTYGPDDHLVPVLLPGASQRVLLPPRGASEAWVEISYWVVVVVSLALAWPLSIQWRRSCRTAERSRAGQCLSCGYDLRGGHVRCPECGRAAKSRSEECRNAG